MQKLLQSAGSKKLFFAVFALVITGLSLGVFSIKNSSVTTPSITSSEVEIAATSPNGKNAGLVVPASCPSDLHDAPGNYGQACSACNACGSCNAGSIQCSGACSAGAPALPGGYGSGCTSIPNICGMTNSGTIGCSGCSAVVPSDALCPVCGNGVCNASETCSTCPGDCGVCPQICGDLVCNGSETCSTCSTDCGACTPVCGDGTCNGSETCSTCPTDCGICAAAPTATLTVFPNPVTQGTNATFTYSSTNAVYCQVLIDSTTYIVNGYSTFGAVPYGSGLGVGLHTAAVQCYNASWTGSGWTTVVFTVSAFVPPAPTVDLKINGSDGPISLSLLGMRNITWSGITNAASCTASSSDGFTGSKSIPSGSENLPANVSSDHTLTCTGPGGTTSDSVQVNLSCAASCGAWSSCSVTCGGGVESRSCVASNCSTYIDTQACNTAVCPNYNWKEIAP